MLTRFRAADGNGEATQTVLTPVSGERFGPGQYRDPPRVGEHTSKVLREWHGTGLEEEPSTGGSSD